MDPSPALKQSEWSIPFPAVPPNPGLDHSRNHAMYVTYINLT